MITRHQYLTNEPFDSASETLIVGTIHPHKHEVFDIPFFYGNECSLWVIFHEAFPMELPNPYSLDDIKVFLRRRKIAMSDMIWECERKDSNALDNDLIPIRMNERNIEQIIDTCLQKWMTAGLNKLPATIEPEMAGAKSSEGWTTWFPIDSKVTDAEIMDFEEQIGHPLPEDYKRLLKYKHFYDLNISEASFTHPVNMATKVMPMNKDFHELMIRLDKEESERVFE